jgi:spermidine synthase
MKPRAVRTLLFTAFFLSGISALIYEVVWAKYLALFLGGTSVAHTIVLATFMGGLAVGNAWFGRRADRAQAGSIRLYALLELGIGLLCLLFPRTFAVLSALYLDVARQVDITGTAALGLKVALASAAIFVPCVLMGGTLPLLAKYVVDRLSGVGLRVSVLYFVNTAGAVVGSALGGFLVVERWGLELGMVAASLVNFGIGGVAWTIGRGRRDDGRAAPATPPLPDANEGPSYSPAQARMAFWAIAVAGGLTMLYELVWIRLLGLSMGGTTHSFSLMLVSFISGIALGSLIVGALFRRPRNALLLFAVAEMGVAAFVLAALPCYERLPFFFYRVGIHLTHTPEGYPLFLVAQAATAFCVMVVPTTFMGAALPLASRVRVDGLDTLGRRIGDVFSINTVGTVLGAAISGFLLLPRLGLERTLLLGATTSGAIAFVLMESWSRGLDAQARRRASRALASCALVLALLLVRAVARPGWDPRLTQFALWRWERALDIPTFEVFRHSRALVKVLYARDGADASILVEDSSSRVLRVNGKPDASTGGDMPTQLGIGHLGMLLHRAPREVMVVGLASGTTAAAVLQHPGTHVDVAEISAPILEAASFFESVNHGILRDPRASITIADAREYLLRSRKQYDVIVSEPTNVWVPGVASLFTKDFYDVVRARLATDGLFVQWLPLYSSDPRIVDSVGCTLRAAFPWTSVWLLEEGDLIFVAGEQPPEFDPDTFARRLSAVRPSEAMLRAIPQLQVFADPLLLLGAQIATAEGAAVHWPRGAAPTYRDLFPRMEYQAARAQYVGKPYLIREELDERVRPVGDAPLFLTRYVERHPLDSAARRAATLAFARQRGVYQPLAHSLGLTAVLDGDDDAEHLENASPEVAARVLLARRLGAEVDRSPRLRQGLCEAYLAVHGEALKDVSSVLARPHPEPFVARMEACAAAHRSEAGRYRIEVVRALDAAGYLQPTLDLLLAMRGEGALERASQEDGSALYAAGARLLLRARRPEEALPWAEDAYRLDVANLSAVRIIWALSSRGPRQAQSAGFALLPRPSPRPTDWPE